jgi:hypothetical protein
MMPVNDVGVLRVGVVASTTGVRRSSEDDVDLDQMNKKTSW